MSATKNLCTLEISSESESDAWDFSEDGHLLLRSENNIQRRSGLLDENSNDTMYLGTSSNDECSTEVHLSVESSSDSPVDELPADQGPSVDFTASTSNPSGDGKGTEFKERKALADLMMKDCCKNQCLLHLTGHSMLTSRRKICCLQGSERRQWIIERITDSSSYVNGKLDVKFSIGGTGVCRVAFMKVHGFPPRTLSRAIKYVEQGKLIVEHGNKGKKKATTKCEGAKAWIDKYVNLIGDKMPNSKQIHLPSWDTIKDIYGRYKDDMIKQMLDESTIISRSMFYKIWEDDFPHAVIPEVRTMICVDLQLCST